MIKKIVVRGSVTLVSLMALAGLGAWAAAVIGDKHGWYEGV